MREAVIVEAVRTPVGKRNGLLSGIRAEELAAKVLQEVVKRTGISPDLVEDVIMGCVSQVGEQASDIARQAALIAGFPIEVPGVTIDRQCGSSQQAVHFAAQAVLSGDMDVVIAGGVESMSRVPIGSNRSGVQFSKVLTAKYNMIHQGLSADLIAEKWGISREKMDHYALESHRRALQAQKEGRFDREIMPVEAEQPDGIAVSVVKDEGPRADTSVQKLAALKPAFQEDGRITAGNASQISDGAAAVLIMSRTKAESLGLKPRFRILARAVVGSDPTLMLTGVIPATEKVLHQAGLSIDDIDVFEVNEAFASVPLAWLLETGASPEKLNPNGGAIALGHPLGASGARLMTTMVHELERTNDRYGLQTMCEGYGMANATIIERLD
ncbi:MULTISPECIES: thiolase family protein [Heyndrickxia]|jgi:acetyl-CoA acyltransferase|uniref:Thiolase family protein n=2 Tax=Heyndrickxia coagulans TaxID=1398 RepID=A0AAW7CIM2_HEYCO|nr:thiolase family protein [Heyndrickxia coagulans]AJH79272.1 acetyl-CoA C-acyltransferase family protein [Heyndrickxia coagulans DSM 1 = ATCC 7050]KYC59968.1 3-ketoacyl-CoA thiolase [Heyndrickxia coagulans]MCR2846748.1 thiolase family protein [Heyndrickxia coagulans]MDL5040748.1 thiolase family protein [Heyndrickxia coagulans]MDR4224972.1 thiolase family protein [Heyndrickxia coagulans DSM 1 = ATCC 7050]